MPSDPVPMHDLTALAALLAGRRTLVLSGAGISTESGIPDYRGPGSARRPSRPILYQEFLKSPEARRRYWARSAVGWPAVRSARPNRGHAAVAGLERAGLVTGVLTQNVDGLHGAAGSRRVTELHGRLATVRCLACAGLEPRDALQERLLAKNPALADHRAELAPDGDAELPAELIAGMRVPACAGCGGVLKPDVVFFGENVPRERLEEAWALLDEAEALLVVGSSLTVFSGYRFVHRAAERSLPVAIVNDGPTRGDAHAAVRLGGRLGEVLPALAARLQPNGTPRPGAAGPAQRAAG